MCWREAGDERGGDIGVEGRERLEMREGGISELRGSERGRAHERLEMRRLDGGKIFPVT